MGADAFLDDLEGAGRLRPYLRDSSAPILTALGAKSRISVVGSLKRAAREKPQHGGVGAESDLAFPDAREETPARVAATGTWTLRWLLAGVSWLSLARPHVGTCGP
jgi:hypothetical protein